MYEVSIFRLYVLRAMYAFMAVGLAISKWPGILNPPADLPHMASVVGSVLGAISILAVLGIRYPLKMLPLLFFEFLWKFMWVLLTGLPHWFDHQLDPNRQEILINCLVGIVLVPLVLPWGYIFRQYVKSPGDPWRGQMRSSTSKQPSSPTQATTSSHL